MMESRYHPSPSSTPTKKEEPTPGHHAATIQAGNWSCDCVLVLSGNAKPKLKLARLHIVFKPLQWELHTPAEKTASTNMEHTPKWKSKLVLSILNMSPKDTEILNSSEVDMTSVYIQWAQTQSHNNFLFYLLQTCNVYQISLPITLHKMLLYYPSQ